MSKYVTRAAIVEMLRNKAVSMLSDTDDEAQYQFACYNRAADLVDSFNEPEGAEASQTLEELGTLVQELSVCTFCDGKGQYEGYYETLPCFKCNGTGKR